MPFIPLHDKEGAVRSWARVDAEDYDALAELPWYLGTHGYAVRTVWVKGHFLMHRQLLGLDHGDDREVDHINRNRLDNRRKNLRTCTHAENMQNVPFRGVHFFKRTGRWQAYTRAHGGKRRHLGFFDTEAEAAAAVEAAT